ncbi:hypothetical protein [Thauera aromatica]|uniref:hypothetical protein n=1 Tax=Thauera aromatica TaxID=59405 RepID=UPI001FFDE923|nr:hypothetical protein [Thauera aromatica]MCK2095221.1 hypothetical protein [Thauera aromatica]
MRRRALNIATAIDQCLFVLLTLGAAHPDETPSAAAWRLEGEGRPTGRLFRPAIDWIFARLPFGLAEQDHCRKAYESERLRQHLPEHYRTAKPPPPLEIPPQAPAA